MALDLAKSLRDHAHVDFLLAHLSDAHIGPLPKPRPFELAGKRLTGYLNWTRGRSRLHDMTVLGKLLEDLRAQSPDHIAMTGDILNLALPGEFENGRRWIETLGPSERVSFTPGNHDAYVPGAMGALFQRFAPWTGDDGGGVSVFPYLRRRDGIAIIGLNSGVPTAPFLASGRLGAPQRAAFEAMLIGAKAEGLVRVVLIHHPPHRAGASPGRNLTDARSFEKIIARRGAELILHGHNHRQSVVFVEGEGGPVPVIGVASASAVPGTHAHRAAYHLYRIRKGEAGVKIEGWARGIDLSSGDFCDLGPIKLCAYPGGNPNRTESQARTGA